MPCWRVLITNNSLGPRHGSELYVRDVALALLSRGHSPVAYSTQLGAVAEELRRATIPVIDDLDHLTEPPDVIHGQHHLDTMTALLHFPESPAVYVCHGWLPWQEAPPRAPSIFRYVAVDHLCRERLVCESGIPADRVRTVLNFVDLKRFRSRPPLPMRPARALVFSNAACDFSYLPAVRAACAARGLACDVLGEASGAASAQPESVLAGYDVVFAKARAALEAMAVGSAVVLCDAVGAGPMVTSVEFDRLRALNFGVRTLRNPLRAEVLAEQIARFNPEDARAVSQRVRAEAGLESAVDSLETIYAEAMAEHQSRPETADDSRAAARYLRGLASHLKQLDQCQGDRRHYLEKCEALERELNACNEDRRLLRIENDRLAKNPIRRRVGAVPILGPLARAVARTLIGRR